MMNRILITLLLVCRYAFSASAKNLRVESGVEFVECLNDCSKALGDRGRCEDGVCICKLGYIGDDCSVDLTDIETEEERADREAREEDLAMFGGKALAEAPPEEEVMEEKDATCDKDVCEDLCTYGGDCITPYTCLCLSDDFERLEKKKIVIEKATGTWAPVNEREASAMRALFESLQVKDVNPTSNPCKWEGVQCSEDGHIIEISLPRKGLKGSLPVEPLLYLPFVSYFDLSNNELSGIIPFSIGSMRNLQDLMLHRNQLSGPIPKQIGGCDRLQTLSLYGNQLSGQIPKSINLLGQVPSSPSHLLTSWCYMGI